MRKFGKNGSSDLRTTYTRNVKQASLMRIIIGILIFISIGQIE